ncbi:hypothetical protein [Amycolatopsis lurida]|uniref:hypothetical protein n=1 Tax=Amycolatopsis lurida TaxID=31959 RepID=UPI00115FF2B0|nr:hypothetical protein [Amycolatopsis lurida]
MAQATDQEIKSPGDCWKMVPDDKSGLAEGQQGARLPHDVAKATFATLVEAHGAWSPMGLGCESHFRNVEGCESGFRNTSGQARHPAAGQRST